MPYRVRSIDEILNDVNQKLAGDVGKPYIDPALQPGFRVKTGDELSGYTRELPDAESARLGREYGAAGSNNPAAYEYGSFLSGLRTSVSPAEGFIEGAISTVGTVVDPLAYMAGQGTPVNDYLMRNDRLKMEQGYGAYEGFFSNVAKSVTKVFAGARAAGTAGVVLNTFVEPAAQSYRRAKEAGWEENTALAYGAAHGAVESGSEFLLDKIPGLGGLSTEATKMFSRAVAGDLAQATATGLVRKLGQVAQTGAGEGMEEVAAFVLGDWVDRAAANMTGDDRLQRKYETTSEYLWDAAQSFALGAAAGGLISGGIQSINWANTREALRQIEQQPTPNPVDPTNAPQQPTSFADPNIPLQPTGPSQPAAIDPGQGVEPEVTQPSGFSGQLPEPNQFPESGKMVETPVAQPPTSVQPQSPVAQQPPVEAAPIEQPAIPQPPAEKLKPTRYSDRYQKTRPEEVPDPGEGDTIDLAAELQKKANRKRVERLATGDMVSGFYAPAEVLRPKKYDGNPKEWQAIFERSVLAAAKAGKIELLYDPQVRGGYDGIPVGKNFAIGFKLADKEVAPAADESMDLTPPEYRDTKSLIANLPPERLAKIAALDQASDAAFAKALGGVRRKLPVELNTKEKREFAVATARKTVEYATARKNVEQIKSAIGELSKDGATGGLVGTPELRAKFPEMSKQQFDAAILQSSRLGVVSIHRHDNASNLSPQDRDMLVTDGNGNFYAGAAIRGASGKKAAQPSDESMDQSEEAADLGPRKPAVTNNLVQDPSDPVMRIIDAMTPAIRENVAKIQNPTMREFARAMGLANINQLPPELADATSRGKVVSLVRKMGQSPQTRAPVPSADRQVTFANSKDRQGVRGTPTGQNLAGPAQGVATTPEKIIELVKTSAESVLRDSKQKIPLNEMKGGGNQRGAMNRRVGSARVDSRMNGPTIFHEMGHAIETGDKVVLSPPVGSKAESELRTIGKAQTKSGGYAAKDILPEGRAEFIRLYVQEGPAFLKAEFPQLFDHFVKTMEDRQPRALLNLTAAAAEYDIYIRKMNAVDRAGSRIAEPKGLADYFKQFKATEYWRGLWDRANGAFIDIAEVSDRMDKAAREYSKKVMGVELGIPKRLRPDSMLVYLHGLAASHTQMWLDSQPVMWDGTRQGKSLREILGPLLGKKEWIDAFNRLLLAKRTFALQDPETLDRMNDARVLEFVNNAGLVQVDPNQQGPDADMRMPNVTIKRIDPRSTGLSLNDARAAMYMLEAEFNGTDGKPNFREILDDYYEFHDLLLQYASDASPTLKLSVDRIRAVNEDGIPLGDPGAYVPLLREFDDDRAASPTASAASGQIGRRLVGSDRQIKDPLMATVMNLEARLTTIHERVMLESVLAMADTPKIPGLAPFIMKLAPGESGKDGLQTFEAVDRAGELARYQINDQGVVRLLHAMDPVSFASHMMGGRIIDKIIVGPNRVLKNFATAFNPRFAFLTQTIFSIPEMLAIGGSFADPNKAKEATNLLEASIRRTKNHAELMAQMAVNLVAISAKKSTLDRFIPGQYFQNIIAQLEQARADGVTFENSIRNDESVAWNISRDIAGRTPFQIQKEDGNMALFKWGMTEVPRWIGSAFGVVPEAAAMSVYQAKLRELGLKPGDAKTIEQRMDIAEAVKESTGNYARRGSTMRYLEKLRPYSSAGVVHGMSLLRAIKADPLNVTQVMGYATILGLLAVAKAMEDDEYLEADITQKVKYLHVKHDGKWYLLPQYSEFGLMTHGAAVVALHSLKGQNEDAWRGLMESVKTLGASVLGLSAATGIPVIDEAISQLMNEDVRQGDNLAVRAFGLGTRSGSPIVPGYNDKRDGDVQPTVVSKRKASEQFTDKTTWGAKKIGQYTGLSPMRIEHAADTITGRQFSNVQKAIGEGDPLKIVAPISRKEGELSFRDKSTDFLYEKIKEANERANDPRQKESKADRDKRLMLESADRARDAWSALQRATKDPDKVKEYAAKKREVSRVAVEQYDKGDVSKSAFAVQERVAKVLLAKEWDQPEDVAELVANGVDDLTRGRQPKIADQKELERQQEDARQFIKVAGLSSDEVLSLHDQHTKATQDKRPADKRDSRESLAGRRRRLQQNLAR